MTSRLRAAWLTIPAHLQALPEAIFNPILGALPESRVSQGLYGVMMQRFAGPIGAFAYLLFVLLYIPCISTIAVIARELNRYWALLSLTWNTVLAYGVAAGFYQLATLTGSLALMMYYSVSALLLLSALFFVIKRLSSGGGDESSRHT